MLTLSHQPIQRITRYELLFKDLCKVTPSCDDPVSHAVTGEVLSQLAETCRNVNEARSNPEKIRLLESSWLLQNRLYLQDKVSKAHPKPWNNVDHGRFLAPGSFSDSVDFVFVVLCSLLIGREMQLLDVT